MQATAGTRNGYGNTCILNLVFGVPHHAPWHGLDCETAYLHVVAGVSWCDVVKTIEANPCEIGKLHATPDNKMRGDPLCDKAGYSTVWASANSQTTVVDEYS